MKAPDLQSRLVINVKSPNTALASQQRLSVHTDSKNDRVAHLGTAVYLKKLDQSES